MTRRFIALVVVATVVQGCVPVIVQVPEEIVAGREFSEDDQESITSGTTTRNELTSQFGSPLLWLPEHRIAVYGLIEVEPNAFRFIDVTGGISPVLRSFERDAFFVAFDARDVVTDSGRLGTLAADDSWLGAALEWAEFQGLELNGPSERFELESAVLEESLVYFYRPRDRQFYFPGAAPAERIAFNSVRFVDVFDGSNLLGQLRWQSYLPIRLPPGKHEIVIVPYVDQDAADTDTSTLSLDLQPATTYFVDVQVESGKGCFCPIVSEKPLEEAIPVLEMLRETW